MIQAIPWLSQSNYKIPFSIPNRTGSNSFRFEYARNQQLPLSSPRANQRISYLPSLFGLGGAAAMYTTCCTQWYYSNFVGTGFVTGSVTLATEWIMRAEHAGYLCSAQ